MSKRAVGLGLLLGITVSGSALAGNLQDRLGAHAGGGMLASLRPPAAAFDSLPPPPAPDYSRPEAWAARPEREDAADVVPPGVRGVDQTRAPVDVFFIYPTSFFSDEAWNASIEDSITNEKTDSGSLRNQASAFNGCCRIYAPRYRQATLGAFFTRRKDEAQQALELAYRDVVAAFDYYLAHDNGGRPFMIASHSQGSRHAVQLLADRIDRSPARARFAAAYIIGNAIPEDVFTRNYSTIHVCANATDTGCVVTWSTYAEGANARWSRDSITQRYGESIESNRGKPIVCTNPLTWTMSPEYAPATLNLGAWTYGRGAEAAPVRPAATGARCEDGALFTDPGTLSKLGLGGTVFKNEHILDYQLFYMNIRANAAARAQAFLAAAQK